MSKPKTEYGNFTFKEVAMVAAIMGDSIMDKLYAKVQERGEGYMSTADVLSDWAVEFAKKHKKTSWEKVLEKGMKSLSKEVPEIICWDDAVIDFAHHKLETF
jgi:hypothetical protein